MIEAGQMIAIPPIFARQVIVQFKLRLIPLDVRQY